jgi:hypothetical protein
MHNKALLLLFTVPAISIVVIGLYQFCDESFKKHFILERRTKKSPDQAAKGVPRRRYTDSVPPGTLRNPEKAPAGSTKEVPKPQVHGV